MIIQFVFYMDKSANARYVLFFFFVVTGSTSDIDANYNGAYDKHIHIDDNCG